MTVPYNDSARAERRIYYKTHKEEINARCKAWYETHKDERKASKKIYYEAYKEKILAHDKIYPSIIAIIRKNRDVEGMGGAYCL